MACSDVLSAGIRAIVTMNPADFQVFGCFTILEP